MGKTTRVLARIAVLAGVYVALTVLPPFNALGYSAVQVRVSEALAVLPYFGPWAPWGLYIGCILANLGSPFLLWDVTLGAFASLIAAILTGHMPKKSLAPLPPVLLNAVTVSAYVAPLSGLSYWSVVLYIGIGQAIACYGLGYPLLLWVDRNERLKEVLRGPI
ncbi:MAG: QueT transporter family protein [Bacillota bacterium]